MESGGFDETIDEELKLLMVSQSERTVYSKEKQ